MRPFKAIALDGEGWLILLAVVGVVVAAII